jgi:serine/threonine protein kinase
VIFRDLKPDNVIVTPSGELKLIDFGIARFFKPGQTHNTVNLGTPGYASPEHGGKGQTDPRSDVYSLGVMLHQMVTGYDPTATPFTLPPARSLNATVPQYVEDAIRRATQLQPAQRFQTVAEFRQALLAPAQAGAGRVGPTGTTVISGAGNGSGVSVGQGPTPSRKWWPVFALLGFAVVVILLLASQLILPPSPTPTPLPRPSVTVSVAGPLSATSAPQQPAPVPQQPASASQQPPSQPQMSSPTPPDVAVDDTPLGRSVGGRDITMLKVGKPDGPAVFVVGSIEGDQPDTSSIVYQLADHYRTRPAEVPNGRLLFLIPSLNPDGNANDSRLNLNGVDLNRNWDTANWKKDAVVPGGSKAGSGGSQPFSELETRALRDLINSLLSRGQPVTLLVLHSTVNDSLSNQVFPGYTASGIHGPSEDVTRRVGNALGYRYNTAWSYDTTGEAIAWAAEQSIPAVDIVPKKNNGPSLSEMIKVITEILR